MTDKTFALLYDLAMWPAERFYLGRLRRELLGAATGRVLEIGAGTGANARHYPVSPRVVLAEPHAAMLARAPAVGARRVVAPAELLPFPSASFDTVVSTLVLCTVQDPGAALSETRRVLRPGGRLLLLEHVRSQDARAAAIQSRLTPSWSRIARGCHLNRDTLRAVDSAGFRVQTSRRLAPFSLFPLILVTATTVGGP